MSNSPLLINPFPGLRPFREDEDYLFFGREEQTMELLQQLGAHRFVAVVGTSGSGKSSLVRCGLLSELLGGKMLQAGASWEIAVTHPGGNPLAILTEALLDADLYDREEEHAQENLLATLSRSHFGLVEAVKQAGLGASTNFLLVVDQFEEIFRFHEAGQVQREVANEFISLLLEAVAQKEVPIYIVLTMRSDFIGECGQFEGLAEMVNQGEFLIPRLSREQYKRVIEGPIKVAGGQIAARLLQRLLNDLGQQSDQLPCLQHALMRTWNVWSERGDTDALDLDDYQQVGKMSQALSMHADEIFDFLASDRQRALCRGMFQALTVQESEQRGIRRPQRLGKLAQILEVSPDELRPIIDAYRRSGVTFLMPSEEVELTERTIIDISHESLMRVWTRLRRWVEEEAQAANIYRRLSESAALHKQGKAGLYRDPELGIALAWKEAQHPNQAWAERYHPDFETAMLFLEESRKASIADEEAREAARQRELEHAQQLAEIQKERLEHQQRAASRLRKMMAGVAGIAVVALIAFAFALIAHNKANHLAEIANQEATKAQDNADKAEKAQQETAEALTQVAAEKDRAEQSLVIAEEAERRSREFRYATDMQLAGRLIGDEGATARQILDRLADHDPAHHEELESKGDLRGFEWHYLRRKVDSRGTVFSGYEKPVVESVLTAEGELLTLDEDYQLKRWDVETHLETGPPLDLKQQRNVLSHALSCDGRLAALGIGDEVHLIDTKTGEETVRPISIQARYGLVFSSDNQMLITVDTRIGWWETATGRVIALDDSHLSRPGPVSVSADGLTIAVGGQYRTYTNDSYSVFRMNPQTRAVRILLNKQFANMGSMRTLVLSPDGNSLIATQLFSGAVVLFDATTGAVKSQNRTVHAASVSALGFSPDGTRFVTASLDGTIKIWDDYHSLANSETRTLMGHADEVNQIRFGPDGKILVSSSLDLTARVWDLENETTSLSQPMEKSLGYRARFSPDGLFIAASEGGNERIPLWSAATGELVRVIPRQNDGLSPDSVAFSPDSRLLALGFGGETNVSFIELWNIDREELLATLPATTDIPGFSTGTTNGLVTALEFSPDGKFLVAGYGSMNSLPNGDRGSHPLLVYDVDARRLVRRLEGPRNYSISVTFSRDGSRLANACYDGTARIWNTKNWNTIQVLQNPDESTDRGNRRMLDVSFSPDGELLAAASHEGNVHVWNAETGQLVRTLRGHTNGVWSVSFSPDGLTLASGSRDQTVRLWNRATWRELLQLEYESQAGATSITFSPDGTELLAAGSGTVVWSTLPEDNRRTQRMARQLTRLLDSGVDLQNRLRMLSGNPRLHEALEILQAENPDNKELQAALAAGRANWHASREEWQAAAERFDQLKDLAPHHPEDWLRTSGLIRLATALSHKNRPAEAAALLAGGEQRRKKDGNGTRVVIFGFETLPGHFPLKLARVYRGSPASQAGLRTGDVILKFNDVELTADTYSKYNADATGGAGTRITLTVQHPDQEQTETVELTKQSFVYDDRSNELIESLLAVVDQKLSDSPGDAGLLELRAEIAGLSSGFERQVADYTAAIESLSQQPADEVAEQLRRLHLKRGDAYVGLREWQQAHDDYSKGIHDEIQDETRLTNYVRAAAETKQSEHWDILRPIELLSSGGSTLTVQEDGSILASGVNPPEDVYTVIAKPGLSKITGIALEALPDSSLPYNGPGRSPKEGNFHLNEILVYAGDTQVPLSDFAVTHDQGGGAGTKKSIDGELGDEIGWSVYGKHVPAHAIISLDLDRVPEEELKVELHFSRAQYKQHNLGRFRLSVTDVASPEQSAPGFFDLQTLSDPWLKLAALFRLEDNQQAIDELVAQHPKSAAMIGDLFIQGEDQDWQRAIEIYSQGITAETKGSDLFAKRARAYEALKDWNAAAADWARVANQRPNGVTLLAEFADRLVKAEQVALAKNLRQEVRGQLESNLQDDPGDLPVIEQLAEVVLTQSEPIPEWTPVEPAKQTTENGAALAVQEDGSMRVQREPLTVSLPDAPNELQAIRVETSSEATGSDFKEYRILSSRLRAEGFRGRYVRIDLPGENKQFPRNHYDKDQKMINLAELQVFRGEQNIALGKHARQSGTYEGQAAARAIDGVTDSRKAAESVAHTTASIDGYAPWWELDLGEQQDFDRLVIWNRVNFTRRMNYCRVSILDDARNIVFQQLIAEGPNPSKEIKRQLQLAKTHKDTEPGGDPWQLTLGKPQEPHSRQPLRISTSTQTVNWGTNEVGADDWKWAFIKPTVRSAGTGTNLIAAGDGTFRLETQPDAVALSELPEAVRVVRVETASDSGSDQADGPAFKDYRIERLDAPRAESGALQGRYVRIDLPGDSKDFPRSPDEPNWKVLSLNEVQVFSGEENVAPAGTASQSTTEQEYAAPRAIDGTTTDQREDGSQSFTVTGKAPGDSWWEVDLGGSQPIDRIVVWNRIAYRPNRLNHFRVRILDTNRRIIFEQVIDKAPDPSRELNCRSMLVANGPSISDQPQWSLRLSEESGINPGERFRVASTEELDSLERQEQIAEARMINPPTARLAAAYDLDGETSQSAVWFRRALENAEDNHNRKTVLGQLQDHPQPLAELIQQRPDDIDLQLTLARSHADAGQKLLAQDKLDQALSEFLTARDIFTRLQEENPASSWSVLTPIVVSNESKAELQVQDDNSVLVQNPDGNDTFSLKYQTSLKGITGLRLETFSDSRLPGGGPGTNDDGNFLLSELTLQVASRNDSAPPRTIGLVNAVADFSQADNDVGDAVDGNDSTHWAIHPQFNQDHTAVFKTVEPVGDGAETELTIRLTHAADVESLLVGRFRLSVTNDADPDKTAMVTLGLAPIELAELDVAIGKTYAQLDQPNDAAAAFAKGLDRLETDEGEGRRKLIEQFVKQTAALRELAKLRSGNRSVQLTLAKRLAEVGKQALADRNQDEALEQLSHARELFAGLMVRYPESQWTVLEPAELNSKAGATLTLQDDGSVFVGGELSVKDTITFETENLPEGVRAIRLEALRDERLPRSGPGTHGSGNFVLSEFKLLPGPASDAEQIANIPVQATYGTFEERPVKNSLVAGDSGWSIAGGTDSNQAAVFELGDIASFKDLETLRIVLDYYHEAVNNVPALIGRFRLSVTDDPDAIKVARFHQELKASGLADLQVYLGNAYGQREQWGEAASAFSQALDLATDRDARLRILQDVSAYADVLDKLIEMRPGDASFHDALARHYQQEGNFDGALSEAQTARTLYEERLETDRRNTKVAKDLSDLLLDVRPAQWSVLEPAEVKSERGAVFAPQADGSILVSGPNVPGDTYTLQLESSLETIRVIRLEVLPDESLPNRGPGRHPSGNFQLQAFRLYGPVSASALDPVPHPISEARASFQFSSSNVDVEATFDESSDKVWHVWTRTGQRHYADYLLEKPLHFDRGTQLKIELEFKDHTASLNLGRFRLSVTDDPEAFNSENTFLTAARISAPFSRLAAVYDALGDSDKSLEMFVRAIELADTGQGKAAVVQQAARFDGVSTQLLERFPDNKFLQLGQTKYLAQQQFDESHFKATLELLTGLVDDFPDDIELLNLRAEAYFKLSQWQPAAADYARVLELESDAARQRAAERKVAECQFRRGQFREGADVYLRQMLLFPNAYSARDAFVAELLDRNFDTARLAAAEFYEQVANNADLDANRSRWLVLVHTGIPGLVTEQNRIRLLQAADKAGGDWTETLTAAIHYRLGNLEQAQPLLRTSDGRLQFRALAAMLLYDRGESSQAHELLVDVENRFDRQRQSDPDSTIPAGRFWQSWSTQHAVLREAKRKLIGPRITGLDELLAKEPENISALIERAGLLSEANLDEEALDDLNAALKIKADLNEAVGLRGRILAGLNKTNEAMIDLNKAIKQGSTDPLVYAARGRNLFERGETEQARDDLNHSMELQPTQAGAKALTDLLLSEAKDKISWTVLRPTEMKSVGGATLTRQTDGSILAGGENPSMDQYELVIETDQKTVTAFRLEVMTDESLPRTGPGRGATGNFAIRWNFTYRTKAAADEDHNLPIAAAVADFSFSKHPINKNHWNIQGGQGSPHEAFLKLEEPIQSDSGYVFTITLRCPNASPHDDQNLGRFRISMTGNARAFEHERDYLKAVETNNPWIKLFAAYRLSGNESAITGILEQKPELQLEIADYYASEKQWEQAIALYNKFITDETTDPLLLAKRAEAYSGAGQWELAETDWKRAFELDPENATLPQRRRTALEAGEQWMTIAKDFNAQLDELPEERHSYRPRSQLIRTIIDRKDPVFEALRKLRPDDTLLTVNLARDFVRQSDWKNAVKHYAVVENDPPSEEWYEYGAALLLAGEKNRYRSFMTKILQQVGEVEDPYMAFYLARTVSLTPKTVVDRQLAAKWGENGVPDPPQAWFTHAAGLAHFRAGNLKQARQWLEQSAATNWHKELNQLALTLVCAEQGDLLKAREYFELAEEWFEQRETERKDGYYNVQDTDWLEANLLRREAQGIFNPQR